MGVESNLHPHFLFIQLPATFIPNPSRLPNLPSYCHLTSSPFPLQSRYVPPEYASTQGLFSAPLPSLVQTTLKKSPNVLFRRRSNLV
jgi:hypothetical protein